MAPPPTPEWLLDTSWTRLYRGKVVTHFRVRSKVVALTLDDGPDGSTPKVVAALRQYGAHATFFWRGRGIPAAEASAALLDGDELANHTLNHIELQGSATDTDRQIDEMNEQFERIQGRKPIWVRAAVGRVNGTALREVWARHQLYANWNIHAEDTNWSYGAERIMSNVLGGLQPGAVILMHQTRPDTVKLLPELLKRIEARGYRVVTLSELAWMEASGK